MDVTSIGVLSAISTHHCLAYIIDKLSIVVGEEL